MKISTTKAAHAIAQSWDLSHHDEKKVKRAMKKAHIHCELHKSIHDKSMTAEVRVQIHGGEEKTIKVVQDKHDHVHVHDKHDVKKLSKKHPKSAGLAAATAGALIGNAKQVRK